MVYVSCFFFGFHCVICYCLLLTFLLNSFVKYFVTFKCLCNKCLLLVSVFHLCKNVAFVGNCVRQGAASNFDGCSFLSAKSALIIIGS